MQKQFKTKCSYCGSDVVKIYTFIDDIDKDLVCKIDYNCKSCGYFCNYNYGRTHQGIRGMIEFSWHRYEEDLPESKKKIQQWRQEIRGVCLDNKT